MKYLPKGKVELMPLNTYLGLFTYQPKAITMHKNNLFGWRKVSGELKI